MDKWDERFIELAKLISTWSKDNSTRCGSVIVDKEHRVVSVGYNGFPRGCDDNDDIYSDRPRKLLRVVHAEANAILSARRSVEECSIYVYPFTPCSQCMSLIIQSGIQQIITLHPSAGVSERWKESLEESEVMAKEAGILLRYFGQYNTPRYL